MIENRQTSLFSGIWREIRKKIHQKFAEKCKNSTKKLKQIGNSIIQSGKNVDAFWLKFRDCRAVQRSALRRSRRELSNACLLAKFGAAITSILKGGGITPTVIDVITQDEIVKTNADSALGITLTPMKRTLEKMTSLGD